MGEGARCGLHVIEAVKAVEPVHASTCVSRPNMMIMTKKQTAQSCGTGIMDTALGKTMKASPGPVRTRKGQSACAYVHKYHPQIMLT